MTENTEVEPDLSWFFFAVTRQGDVMILDHSEGWTDYHIEPHWEDTFASDPPNHLKVGSYLWSGFEVGYWGEDDLINCSGGTFTPQATV